MLIVENLNLTREAFALTAAFTLPQATRAAIIGPSGGGKSTLLSLIAGFDTPNTGRILWNDTDLTTQIPGQRPVAMIFQDNNLFPHLDLLTNVALGASPQARPSAEARAAAATALSRVGLSGMETRKPNALSGGQQSRAALARLILTARPVVLMDEPFSALGPAMRAEMLDLVAELLPEATILMVTHDPEDARRFADKTIFVDAGVVAAPQDTDVLFASPGTALAAYLR